ncbi:MAG: FHA domain-containing protein [Polyangiales bacterium]
MLSAAELVQLSEDGSDLRSFTVRPGYELGSDVPDICIEDPYLSPQHACFVAHEDGGYAVRDLNSVNGVYLRIQTETPLGASATILLGQRVFQYTRVTTQRRAVGPATDRGTYVFGSPVHPYYGSLVERTVEGSDRSVYWLYRDETVLGREVGDIVFTDDPFMSRKHAVIRHDGAGGVKIEDLGSSNGSYVRISSETRMHEGDQIRLGSNVFRFRVGEGQ